MCSSAPRASTEGNTFTSGQGGLSLIRWDSVVSTERVASTQGPTNGEDEGEEDEPQLLAGTQTLKRSGWSKSQRAPKRLKDIAPDDVNVESSSSSEAEDSDMALSPSKGRANLGGKKKKKKKAKKSDGWIWMETLTWGQSLGDAKLEEYKKESDRVQWFRAEAEMYRWLEQYERKHVELMRVITRFHRDSVVWEGRANREEQSNGGVVNGAATFARMQAAMYKRLEHNARVVYKRAESGAHYDWVSAATFDELVTKIEGWREVVFKWMDDMPEPPTRLWSLAFADSVGAAYLWVVYIVFLSQVEEFAVYGHMKAGKVIWPTSEVEKMWAVYLEVVVPDLLDVAPILVA
ncbi:hypothetical protein DFH09DRAFT_1110787 [Mycena vulgaris]|nr:hypothetical protein DFH09DRAFT_1110787 [Mycena vulgaris]